MDEADGFCRRLRNYLVASVMRRPVEDREIFRNLAELQIEISKIVFWRRVATPQISPPL
jgi:hypothetical protein